MTYKLDEEIILSPLPNYYASSAHRKSLASKSYWTVTIDEEVTCFIESQKKGWITTTICWGFISNTPKKEFLVLGLNKYNEELKIAKYVAKSSGGVWHGYPADYRRNTQDRPEMDILMDWKTKGHIEKHYINKIRQGKKCKLLRLNS